MFVDAGIGFLERYGYIGTKIIAALRPTSSTAATATSSSAKEILEYIAHGAKICEATKATASARLSTSTIFESGVSKLVIGGTILFVFQRVIGVGDFFELLLGLGITRIYIRVIFLCQFTIGRF